MSVSRKIWILGAVVLAASFAMAADTPAQQPSPAKSQQQAVINSIFYQEAKLVENMHKYTRRRTRRGADERQEFPRPSGAR
ncbi:MAG: hypothetical protein DMG61_16720 [Acidobacteria bacterium]|nr:MAG: hypothetical protein DMG61_16720 [Acidobacteriota bacterium]